LARNKEGGTTKMDKGTQQNENSFDAIAVLNNIRASRSLARRLRFTRSKLDRYRAELVSLRHAGASLSDIVYWLRKEKRMRAQRTTIQRYLNKLPEMKELKDQNPFAEDTKLEGE
jgi:hypothetical protein